MANINNNIQNYLDLNNYNISDNVINHIKTLSLLDYPYIDNRGNECMEKAYGNNCFLKATCDAISSLRIFNELPIDNNNYGKLKRDILYVSSIGGLEFDYIIQHKNNNYHLYKDNNEYQKDIRIGCMASALTINNNNEGRYFGNGGEVEGILIYIFNVLSNIHYQLYYTFDLNDINDINNFIYINNNINTVNNNTSNSIFSMISNFLFGYNYDQNNDQNYDQNNLYDIINNWKQNMIKYNRKMEFIINKIIKKDNIINNDDFSQDISSYYKNFCMMIWDKNNKTLTVTPVIDIIDYNTNEQFINYNEYLSTYFNNTINILYIDRVCIIKINKYYNNIRFDLHQSNIIMYKPNNNYKLKSVIYSKKDNKGNLVNGHFICVRNMKNYCYKIFSRPKDVDVEDNDFYAYYLFYEKIN